MLAWIPRGFLMTAALFGVGCGGLGNDPPQPPPMIRGADGTVRHVLDRGRYKAYYDKWGRLEHIDHDSNGDGRPDRILRHDGAKAPHRVEIDVDFDGRMDRWEDFTPDGKLSRWSVLEDGRAQRWTVVAQDGTPARYEYDRDGDGRIERAEIVVDGKVARVELDTDRDGRMDRWQEWRAGRLIVESLDTDGDGRPDRELRRAPDGALRLTDRPRS